MIFVFEVSYALSNGTSLPVQIKQATAQDSSKAKLLIESDCPDGLEIKKMTLIGSKMG